MAQLESDELEQLMPNLQGVAQQQGSPGDTAALREYIHVGPITQSAGTSRATTSRAPQLSADRLCPQVLAEKPINVRDASGTLHKRTDGLQVRAGTGRRPQRRYFTIKWRCVVQPLRARLLPHMRCYGWCVMFL